MPRPIPRPKPKTEADTEAEAETEADTETEAEAEDVLSTFPALHLSCSPPFLLSALTSSLDLALGQARLPLVGVHVDAPRARKARGREAGPISGRG
jgi:hypothetical protein